MNEQAATALIDQELKNINGQLQTTFNEYNRVKNTLINYAKTGIPVATWASRVDELQLQSRMLHAQKSHLEHVRRLLNGEDDNAPEGDEEDPTHLGWLLVGARQGRTEYLTNNGNGEWYWTPKSYLAHRFVSEDDALKTVRDWTPHNGAHPVEIGGEEWSRLFADKTTEEL